MMHLSTRKERRRCSASTSDTKRVCGFILHFAPFPPQGFHALFEVKEEVMVEYGVDIALRIYGFIHIH